MTFTQQAFEFLDGKTVVHPEHRIPGVLKHKVIQAIYPYPRAVHQLTWEATEEAKKTEAYRFVRHQLHDDWVSDLTDSDIWCDWLEGFVYEPA